MHRSGIEVSDILAVTTLLIWLGASAFLYFWYSFGGPRSRGIRLVFLVNILSALVLLTFDFLWMLRWIDEETYSAVRRHPHRAIIASGLLYVVYWHIRTARRFLPPREQDDGC